MRKDPFTHEPLQKCHSLKSFNPRPAIVHINNFHDMVIIRGYDPVDFILTSIFLVLDARAYLDFFLYCSLVIAMLFIYE
jgi:hypothetical protein